VGNPLLADVSVWTGGNSLLGPSEDTSFYLEGYNAGPNPAAGMQVHWTAPTGVTVTSIDVEPTSLNCTHTTTSVTCNPGSFPVNQWFSVIVNATVAASPTPGTYSADASVTSTTGDRYPADNTSSFPVHVLGPGQTDLEAGIYGPDVVANNVRAHYTAWVYNNGPSDTTGATLTLDLPPLTSYYNTTNDAPTATMDGATCTFSVANHNIVCSGIAIQKYNWKSVEVGITPTVPGNSLPITALLSATVAKAGDPIPENDSAQFYATVYPEGSSDLLVQQTDSADPAAVGAPLKYTVTTLNRGPVAAPNVTVTNTLPSGVTFVSAKRSDGTSCPAPSGLVITCGIGDLQPYDAKAIVVTVTPNSTGPITNTVTATAGSGTDPETANNTGITEGTDVVPDVADSSQASTSTGTVVVDPDTGEVLVTVPRGNPSAVTVQTTAVCPAGQVEDVSFTLGNGPGAAQFNATNTSGSIWSATIPQDQLQSADIYAHVHCNPPNQTYVNQVGTIHLYDPSGVITDADTGAPIAGATVTLYRVPGWSARISPAQNTTPNTCESNLSRAGDWSQAAPTNLGVAADPSSGMIDPAANPLKTTAQGRYGWNVAAGCWYVVVSKTGYTTLTSPVVGVPSEVTDLDLKLHKVTSGGGSSGGGGGGGDGGGSGGGDGGGTPTTTTTTPPTSSVSTPQTTTATPPAKTKCVVPKLVGLSLAKAKKALAKAHCGVGKISKKKAKAKIKGKKPKKGTVIAQLPKAGTKKPAGSKVAITLAK
jgi:uncharacterized repeat protein (TIGR01451 family)